jgi:hypothetical protein
MPLALSHFKRFYSFPDFFFAIWTGIALKLCTWLYIYDLQIKFEDGCYQPNFGRVMPLELSHLKGFYSFPAPGSAVLACFLAKDLNNIWYTSSLYSNAGQV